MLDNIRRIIWNIFYLNRESASSKSANFVKHGSLPWTSGYNEYKWQAIEEVIFHMDFDKVVGTLNFGYRIDERIVELPWLFSRLPQGGSILLDAGSALNHLPLLNHPRLAEKKIFISTLEPEKQAFWRRGISYVYEDLRNTCFRENMFDVIACISTLEHVGLDNTFLYTDNVDKMENDTQGYLPLIDVFHSRLKPGGQLFISVPFGKQKNHGWFQVFDGHMLDAIIARFAPDNLQETIFMYCNDRWGAASRLEARDASCFDVNVEKQYPADYCAFSRAVACLEMTR
jgi:hypothetical protein